jgi:hypothetical protein
MLKVLCVVSYTVTRPHAGFRHPDRMAPDQTVREREHFSLARKNTFLEFSEDLPSEKKKECEHGGIELKSLGVLILSYTLRP